MTNFSIMTQKGTEYINQVLKTDNKIMADGWYISLGIGDIEPTENTENLINPIFGKNDCSGIVFGQDEYGQYAEIIVPTEILKKYRIKEIGLFNHNDLLISVAKTDINLPEDFNFDVKQRIYIKSIPAYITVEYISKDLYMSNLNEKIGSLNQNKANININNLSETGENKLNTSKMYETGAVSTDEQGYNQLAKMKRSTFDKTKFTSLVGTPTISENGIASNFTKNSYATGATIPLSTAKSFSVKCRIKTPKEEDTPYINTYWWLSNNCYLSAYNANTLCVLNTAGIKGTGFNLFAYEKDTLYDVEYTSDIENNQQTLVCTKVSDGTTHTATSSHTFEWADATLRIGVWGEYAMDYGNIDLSRLSIKVDGVEVFSGNKTGIDIYNNSNNSIQIPYTESKTGSKIVDVAYRDRVIDLYEQQGQAGYYTIDEANKNFTLPMGEIYGLITSKADRIGEQLTNYAKKDFSNLTADAISASAGFPFPSGSHIDLSLGPTGSIYFAPADGWFFLWKNISANGQFAALEVLSGDSVVLQVANSVSFTSWNGFIPCKKGDKIRVQYNLGGTTVLFRFIYAVGNAPQSTESED